MAVNPRRPGFRLPWSAEGETPSTASERAPEEASAEVPAANGTGDAAKAAGSNGSSPELTDAASASPEPASADVAPSAPAPESEANPFLQNLVDAMRGVAETSRESSLSELRDRVEQRVAGLRQAAAEAAEELRRRAELDLEGIGDWERDELERIRGEAERKRDERRAQLEKQLADHQAAADRNVTATQQRLADHERELDAFFAQLGEIEDPAAFVAAAKRMPRAPELEAPSVAAPPPDTSTTSPWGPAVDPRLAAMGIARREPAAAEAPADDDAETAEPAEAADPPKDSQLAERLAELDARIGTGEDDADGQAATASPAHASATDTSTPIVVKGLNSFGAITSFKQALERVDGIRGVTLSLGPTGEFVYRASHAPEFDLSGAIRSVEGESADVEMSEGMLKVTVGRPR